VILDVTRPLHSKPPVDPWDRHKSLSAHGTLDTLKVNEPHVGPARVRDCNYKLAFAEKYDPGSGAFLTSPIPDTPHPASLGMLALGAQGVPLWRRKESALQGNKVPRRKS